MRWGFRVRKQMKAVFFSQRYRSELHAMPHTNNGGFSFHLKVPAWPHTQHSFYRTHRRAPQKNAHTLFLFAIFPTFLPPPSASHHELCVVPLSRPFSFIHWSDRVNHSPGERKLPFHSIRLTATPALSICSLILSLFQLDQI